MNISWLKLDVNILDDAKIKIIRSHPDGNAIFVLWIGLLCLAMKSSRSGIIEISDGIPYSVDDIAHTLQIEKKTVELGLALFAKYRMIDTFDGSTIEVVNFSKHQNLERIEEKRELNRLRVARYREKQKECNALLMHNDMRTTCDVMPTEIEREIDIDIDKKEKENNKKKKKKKKSTTSDVTEKIKFLDTVLLTVKEHQRLIDKYGERQTEQAIEILNNAIMSKGYKYKSHYHTIIGWPMKEVQNGNGSRLGNVGTGARTVVAKAGKAASDGEPYPVDFEG